MINKILIRTSDRKTLHKDRRSLGMNGENLQEVLLFCLDEKIEGIGIVEVELPDGTKGMIEVDRTEEVYELPVKSSLLTQTGFVKFQLRILHDDVEIFKSEIIALEVKDSINATETIPEQYPTWIDNLTTLKQELEKAESERVSNENERQSAEKTRQENFTKMQETVSNAVSNIKDLTEEYNSNAKKETKKFNDNAVDQTKTFNDNSDSKLAEYNKNHTDKIKEYDDNAKAKLDEYNENDADKTNAYNDNTVLKEKAYNDNAADKVKEYNTNVEQKETEFEDLAEEKINEYNQVSAELTAKVEQVQAENESLKAENKLIKEQIPSATASGNNIHIEDSGSLGFDWKIRGGHKQERREGYNIINTKLLTQINIKGIDRIINDDGSLTIKGTATAESNIQVLASEEEKLKEGNYTFVCYGLTADYYVNIYYVGNVYGENIRSFSTDGTKNIKMILTIPEGKTVNFKIYPFLIKGTYTKETIPTYEQYGASPSPDSPSEIETVGDNLNFLDIDKTTYDLTINLQKEGEYLKGNNVNLIRIGTWSNSIPQIEEKLKSGNYTISYEVKANSNVTILNLYLCVIYEDDTQENVGSSKSYSLEEGTKQKVFWTLNVQKNVKKMGIVSYLSNSCDIIVSKVKIEKGSIVTPYSPYGMGSVKIDIANNDNTKSQTAIMPIQQEMLTGDYISSVEHHEWEKIVLTGNEDGWTYETDKNEKWTRFARYSLNIDVNSNYLTESICSHFKTFENYASIKNSFGIGTSNMRFNADSFIFVTVEEWKAYLKQQYEAGTPVTIYYKLATPVNLELTEGQKTVKEQKLYTYKNITNIAVSDELASIDVEYKKDLETEHNKLQNQINEIKQLLSTTETSVLLLDNLQKDVEIIETATDTEVAEGEK